MSASEAAAALLRYGFETMKLHRIIATCQPENPASYGVMEKIGMRHVRTVHVDWPDPFPGTEHGEVWYEVARPERSGG